MKKDHINNGTITLIEGSFLPDFEEVVKEFQPQMIVELGFGRGGLTKHFVDWCPEIPIFAFDQYYFISRQDALFFAESDVTLIITSQMFDDNNVLPALLSLPLRKFLFCDNGSKKEEMRFFSGYLRPGDLIGVHDWGEDIEWVDIEDSMGLFEAHPINKKIYNTPGLSCCRFWIKRHAIKKNLNRMKMHIVDEGGPE